MKLVRDYREAVSRNFRVNRFTTDIIPTYIYMYEFDELINNSNMYEFFNT